MLPGLCGMMAGIGRTPVELVASAADITNRSGSYTFAGLNFGGDFSNRTLIAVVALYGSGATTVNQSSVAIGGVTAVGGDTGHGWNTSPWIGAVGVGVWAAKNVPGSSGSVVVNFSNSATAAGIFLLAVTDVSSTTQFDDTFDLSDHGNNPIDSSSVNVPPGGLLIGGTGQYSTTAFNLSGVTKRHEMTVDGHLFYVGYDYRLAAETGRVIGYSSTGNQIWGSQYYTYA